MKMDGWQPILGRSIDKLARNSSAILLKNARIDTRSMAELPILRRSWPGLPGTYLVQSRGEISDGFYRRLEIELRSFLIPKCRSE